MGPTILLPNALLGVGLLHAIPWPRGAEGRVRSQRGLRGMGESREGIIGLERASI
jgi:hypothetical protein